MHGAIYEQSSDLPCWLCLLRLGVCPWSLAQGQPPKPVSVTASCGERGGCQGEPASADRKKSPPTPFASRTFTRKAHDRSRIHFEFAIIGFVYGLLVLWLILRWKLAAKYRDWADTPVPAFCGEL